MIRAGSRLRQIGWVVALSICVTGFVALTFRVNAIKSEVRLAERKIIALEREKRMLEIEFQTRASQQKLANFNRIEYGYGAPTADQYVENERELASFGLPRNASTPDPIRVAKAPDAVNRGGFPQMVSPLTGQPESEAESAPAKPVKNEMRATRRLSDRLSLDNPLRSPAAEGSE